MDKKTGGIGIGAFLLVFGLFFWLRNKKSAGSTQKAGFSVGDYIQHKDGTDEVWIITAIWDTSYALRAEDGSATTAWLKSYVDNNFKKIK